MNMSEMQKHIIFVEGAGQALVERGYLEGPVSITPRGIGVYDQLMASGWMPQRNTVRRLLEDKGVPTEHLDITTALFMRWAEEFDNKADG